MEFVYGHSGCSNTSICFGLGRIIGVAFVVDDSSVQVDHGACQNLELIADTELVMQGITPINKSVIHFGCLGNIFRI